MLAGIAGRTIEEARERMPVAEIGIWQAFMARRGPLALHRRIEAGFAQVSMILANVNRDPKSPAMKLTDFLLYGGGASTHDDEGSADQALAILQSVSRGKGASGTGSEGSGRVRWRRPVKAA